MRGCRRELYLSRVVVLVNLSVIILQMQQHRVVTVFKDKPQHRLIAFQEQVKHAMTRNAWCFCRVFIIDNGREFSAIICWIIKIQWRRIIKSENGGERHFWLTRYSVVGGWRAHSELATATYSRALVNILLINYTLNSTTTTFTGLCWRWVNVAHTNAVIIILVRRGEHNPVL